VTKIVVTTPTGSVGSRVVQLLVQAGARPTLLMREPRKVDAELAERVDAVQGDQLVLDDVLRATGGADALFWVDPPVDDDDPVAAYARAGEHAAQAIIEHGIARTVFQSSVGAEKRHGAGEIDGLARTEETLDATGASVTHLRCGFFFTNLLLDLGALEEGVLRVIMPPLGRGFPTGQVTRETITAGDMRGSNPRFTEEAMEQNLAIVDRVREVAERYGATPGQVALAWLLAQYDRVVPIPGTRRIERLTENAGAAGLQLSVEDLTELDALPAPAGERYSV